jgi:hypothetical protein
MFEFGLDITVSFWIEQLLAGSGAATLGAHSRTTSLAGWLFLVLQLIKVLLGVLGYYLC